MAIGSLATLVTCLLAGQPAGSRLEGTIVDAAGRPCAGADVWLVVANGPVGGPSLAGATTDDEGRFAIPRQPGDPARAWTLWAAKAGHRVARVSNQTALPEGPVRVVLGPPAGSSFRVEGPGREPIAGATVRVTRLDRESGVVPEELAGKFGATTDADGRAVLDAFASDEIVAVEARADGFGIQPRIFSPPGPGPKVIRLRPTGRVAGRLVADDPAAVRGWVVFASTLPDDDPSRRGSWAGTAEATTDREGRFEMPPLAAGKLSLSFTPPEGARYRPAPVPDRTLPAGGEVGVEVDLSRAVRVEGVVRERGGGPPVAGVRLAVSTPSTPNRGYPIWADDRGRYAFESLPGKATVSVTQLPAAYVQGLGLTLRDVTIPEGVDRHELPPIEADRGEAVRGIVLDEAGRPVAGASVAGHWGMTDARGGLSAVLSATTGPDGTFTLEGIHPGADVAGLSARRRDRATATPATARAGQAAPVTLRLASGVTVALGGRVVEAGGQPVADAQVTISHRTRHADGSGSYGGTVRFDDSAEVRTGPDGSFRTPRELARDVEYRAEVMAPGMLPARTAYVRPAPDGSASFPDLVLRRESRQRTIVGRVLDRRGRPVAGAEVSSTGDGSGRGRIVSDADGRFRLVGVSGDAVLVFARAPGLRQTGQVVLAESSRAELVLARVDEPPAEARPVAPAGPTRAEEKALAARLLAPLFPGILTSGDRSLISDALAALARSDTERAIGLVRDQVVVADQGLVARIALGLLDRDPAEATGALRSVADPTTACRAALDVFDARPEQAPAWRRGLLELALGRAREIDDRSERIWLLAEVADRLLALGAVDPGTAVVREAEALAEALPRGGFLFPRDNLAKALARLDLPAALALIGPAKTESYNDRSIYNTAFQAVALRVAASHPAEAERLQGLVVAEGTSSRRSVVLLCARMARADLPRATRLATSEDDPRLRAMALGAMANTLAISDPREARALLDRAFDQLEAPRRDGPSPVEAMAWLLPVAGRIDPGIVSDYLWRCLSDWSPPPAGATAEQVRSSAVVATLVGRFDREAAAVVYAPVLDQLYALIATSEAQLASPVSAAVSAAAAFDPRAVASIVERAPEKAGPDRPKDSARVAAARMIALTPPERLRELAWRSSIVRPDDASE